VAGDDRCGLGHGSSGSGAGDNNDQSEDTDGKPHFGNPLQIQIDGRLFFYLWKS